MKWYEVSLDDDYVRNFEAPSLFDALEIAHSEVCQGYGEGVLYLTEGPGVSGGMPVACLYQEMQPEPLSTLAGRMAVDWSDFCGRFV